MMNIGLIGCGKMGGALLRGVESALGADQVSVTLCDAVPEAVEALKQGLKCTTKAGSVAETAENSDVVILAVKPADLEKVCAEAGKAKNRPLYLSIAAGISLEKLEKWLGSSQRVIRSMPNTPALVGAGAAASVGALVQLSGLLWAYRSAEGPDALRFRRSDLRTVSRATESR